jgi:nitroreductase
LLADGGMSANAFRSPLMQHFASAAKSQHRPPLALSRLRASNQAEEASNATSNLPPSSSVMPISASNQYYSGRFALGRSKDLKDECRQIHSFSKHSDQSLHYFSTMQSHNLKNTTNLSNSSIHETISTRRTNILGPINTTDLSHLRDSVTKAIEMATYAPNHHRTEPTTYYRIFSNTVSSDKLADICYNVSLCRSLKSKPSQVAISNAEDKKNKWLSTIACYIAVTCSNQPIQDMKTNQDYRNSDFTCVDSNNDDEFNYWFHPLSCQYPETDRQLEDYSSSCSSIQNLLLSLHADKYGSKWATGPVIRCRAFRSLIGCKNDELVVGLIMIGTPKIVPTKPWRRRRNFDGDVLRDL